MRKRLGFCVVQKLFNLFSFHRRKLLKKVVDGPAAFEIVKQRFHGYARAGKDRRSAENFWVDADDAEHYQIVARPRRQEKLRIIRF